MPRSTLSRSSFALGFLVTALGLHAQQDHSKAEQVAPVMQDPYQGGWQAKEQTFNANLWGVLADEQPTNNEALLNQYRSERNASLARNNGNIPASDQANLDILADRISTVAPNSFEAHLAQFYSRFPTPTAFTELDLATAQGQDRMEVIGPQLINSVRSMNTIGIEKWSKALKERGNVAPGLWKLTDDMLLSVDKDAILFTAGEMDAYPAWAKQYADNVRKDLLIVDERLLVDAAYRQRIWTNAGAYGNAPEAGTAFISALGEATTRPVFLSLALGPDVAKSLREKLYVTGLAARYSNTVLDNVPILEKNWRTMKKATDAGPLSRNYLLPGSVLLMHYRALGDEEKASLLEHEIRQLADTLGATNNLIRSGVLQH